MGTLYIDRKDCYIKMDSKALAIYVDGHREGIVPLEPIKRVIFIGNMAIETSVLRSFTELGISAIFLSGQRLTFSGMLHGRLHYNGILRLKQYEKAISDFAIRYAREIVERKVRSQMSLLNDVSASRRDLKAKIMSSIERLGKILNRQNSESFNIGSLKGIEGSASAIYFAAYTEFFPESLNFKKRTRRPPLDPVNAMLSLCYTLLHFEIVREIEVIGLDPTIGFYHQFEYGRESIACDIVELFRCNIDRFVLDLFRERKFTSNDFSKDHKNNGYYLKKQKRKQFYPVYEEWAKGMRSRFTEEVRNVARRLLDDKDALPLRYCSAALKLTSFRRDCD